MIARHAGRLSLFLFLLLLLPMCNAATAVRPKEKTANDALGESGSGVVKGKGGTCTRIEDHGTPLIVDWRDENRAAVEMAMSGGVAVVSYTCDTLEVLKDCHVNGDYAYFGVTGRENVVRLSDADEIAANLPLYGHRLGAELAANNDLLIDIVFIGIRRTARTSVPRAALQGDCQRATHFVREADIGAFAMGTATKGAALVEGQLFTVGAKAQSTSSRTQTKVDGNLDACKSASLGARDAPQGCSAPFKLELSRIGGEASREEEAPTETNVCRAGYLLSQGICAPIAKAKTQVHLCQKGDLPDCSAQCDAGDAASCGILAAMYVESYGVKGDIMKGVALLDKACAMKDASSCFTNGDFWAQQGDYQKAVPRLTTACAGGEAGACRVLGILQMFGKGGLPKDPVGGLRLLVRACDAGDAEGCYKASLVYKDPALVKPDPREGLRLALRGCDADHTSEACLEAAESLTEGRAGVQDEKRGVRMLDDACGAGNSRACDVLASYYGNGKHVTKDVAVAGGLFTLACGPGSPRSCGTVGDLATSTQDFGRAHRAYARGCENKDAASCKHLAALDASCPAPLSRSGKACVLPTHECNQGKSLFEPGDNADCATQCNWGNNESCVRAAIANEQGIGTKQNLLLAREQLLRACVIDPPTSARGCGWYADYLMWYARPRQAADAIRFAGRACESGDAIACGVVADGKLEGLGLPKDVLGAYEIYAKACSSDALGACVRAGEIAENIYGGVKPDSFRASQLYDKACQAGNAKGCERLAYDFSNGYGVAKDPQKAASLYDRACTHGSAFSCGQIAALMYDGIGVQRDELRAVRIAIDICDKQREGTSCAVVGDAFAKGRGVARDPQRGSDYWRRACQYGFTRACQQ